MVLNSAEQDLSSTADRVTEPTSRVLATQSSLKKLLQGCQSLLTRYWLHTLYLTHKCWHIAVCTLVAEKFQSTGPAHRQAEDPQKVKPVRPTSCCLNSFVTDKTQMCDPSIAPTLHYFLHNGELTLHYFLTVDGGLVQWPVCQEQKGS